MSDRTLRAARVAAVALFTALLTAAPARVHAQATVINPGDAVVDGTRIKAGTVTFNVTVMTGGQEMQAGTMKFVTTSAGEDGRDMWRIVQSMSNATGVSVDTVMLEQKTLAPVSVRSWSTGSTTVLNYKGVKVTGEKRDPEGSAQAVDQTLSQAAFDSNTIDALLVALPLKTAYAVRIPMFEPETGLVWYVATVVGETAVGTAAAWSVEVRTPERLLHFSIAKADPSVLALWFEVAPGATLKLTKVIG